MEGGVSAMATIISNVGTVLNGLLGWVGDVFTALTKIDLFMFLILIPISVGLIYLAIRIIKKFAGKRKI